jgi:hypothetical protein
MTKSRLGAGGGVGPHWAVRGHEKAEEPTGCPAQIESRHDRKGNGKCSLRAHVTAQSAHGYPGLRVVRLNGRNDASDIARSLDTWLPPSETAE